MVELNHIGITVPHLEEALDWYVEIFDLRRIEGPVHASLETDGAGRRRDVFGVAWGGMKLVHLLTDNGAGIELFEFTEPRVERPADTFEYWRVGISHVAFTVTDVGSTAARIADAGGVQRTGIHVLRPGCEICYCEDPWGNILELSSGDYVVCHPPDVARGRPGPSDP